MRSIGLAICSAAVLAVPTPAPGVDEVIDSVMYHDPEVPIARRVQVFDKDLVPLWADALGRPEADTRIQAATAIALGTKRKVPGLEAAIPALRRELGRDDQHPIVRVAVAKALVALDVKDVAPRFHTLAATAAPELLEIITPALAAWDYRPARADWLARIAGPDTRQRSTLLAIQALATIKDESAGPRLRELALSQAETGSVRLEAARAIAEIRTTGLEADARTLAPASGKTVDRLVAATLVRRHAGAAAVETLQAMARDSEPAVVAVALTRLVELDPKHVLPLLTGVLASPDANVRSLGVEVLLRIPTDPHLTLLADATNDPHPGVRVQARKGLRGLAAAGHQSVVLNEGTRVLAGSDWRGQEQAAILLAQLDHKPAAGRLVEVLATDRGETIVAAAWALRQLDVAATLPAIHSYVRALLPVLKDKGESAGRRAVLPADVDLHLSQLFQFVGRQRYRPADDVLREVVPPSLRGRNPTPVGFEARAAAVWALGRMNEGVAEPALTRLLIGRLTATMPGDMEDGRVRIMCAIALARMKATSAVAPLRLYYVEKKPTLDPINNACGWALEQLTGEKMPPPGVVLFGDFDWFLKPVR